MKKILTALCIVVIFGCSNIKSKKECPDTLYSQEYIPMQDTTLKPKYYNSNVEMIIDGKRKLIIVDGDTIVNK